MKDFFTLDQQIDRLKSRNLIIADEEKARKYLLTNNYYNVINGYSKLLFDQEDHYRDGSTFDEITVIHWYDKEIKAILLKSIIEAEKHFKSVVAYRFCQMYPEKYSFLKIENFETLNNATTISQVSHLISIMAKIIKDNANSKSNNAIKHHLNVHGSIPFWVLVNELTFGQVFNFYRNLPKKLKDKIARDLSSFLQENIKNIRGEETNQIISGETLTSFLKNILEIRNVTAHNNRLLDYSCRDNLPQTTFLRYYNQQNQSRQSVYYVFLSLQCLLSKIQYATLHNTFLARSNRTNNKLKTISISEVNRKLGFPENWHETTDRLMQT